MPKENKDITISLRLNESYQSELNELIELGNKVIQEERWWWLKLNASKMIRLLIQAFYEMPEEQKKELIKKHHSRWI